MKKLLFFLLLTFAAINSLFATEAKLIDKEPLIVTTTINGITIVLCWNDEERVGDGGDIIL